MSITHAKVSAKSDPADTTLVRPSDWNADHVGTIGPIVDIEGGTSSGNASAVAAGVALNAAIAAMPAQGGKIRLGRGYFSYNTGAGLSLFGLTNISIEGISGLTGGALGGTLLEYLGTGSGTFIDVGEQTGCSFHNMEIRYLSTAFTGTLISTSNSVAAQATSLWLEDVLLWGSHAAGQTARLMDLNRSIIGTFDRVFFNGGGIGVMGSRSVAVTGIATGNPCVITAPGHGYTSGTKVNLGGMLTTPSMAVSPPNIEGFTVTVIDANSFSISWPVTAVTVGTGWATNTADFSNVQTFNSCKFIQQVVIPVRNADVSWSFNDVTVQALASGDVGFIDHRPGARANSLTIKGGGNWDQTTTNAGSIIKFAGSGLSISGFQASGRSVSDITFVQIDGDACQGVMIAGNNLNAVKYGLDFGTTTAHIRGQFGPNAFDNDRNGYLPVIGTLPPGIAILPGDQPTKPDIFWWSGGNDGGPEPTRLQFDNDALAYFERSAAGILVTPAILRPAAFGVTATISPTQLVANTDNWNPTSLATAFLIRANVNAALNLTGIVAQPAGTILRLFNTTAFTITLVHEATSTAANRFLCPGATNFALRQKGSVDIMYSSADSRWLVLGA